MSTAKERILKRLYDAREGRTFTSCVTTENDPSIYVGVNEDLVESFRSKLEPLGGNVYQVDNLEDAATFIAGFVKEEKWDSLFCLDPFLTSALTEKTEVHSSPEYFDNMQVGVTPCEFLIAHLGSVMVSSGSYSGRRLHVFPETHIVVAHQGQLVTWLDEALQKIQEKYQDLPSMISNITGPSRTADIEKTLVKGMHGPRRLVVIICKTPFGNE